MRSLGAGEPANEHAAVLQAARAAFSGVKSVVRCNTAVTVLEFDTPEAAAVATRHLPGVSVHGARATFEPWAFVARTPAPPPPRTWTDRLLLAATVLSLLRVVVQLAW